MLLELTHSMKNALKNNVKHAGNPGFTFYKVRPSSRGGRTRTADPRVPNAVRCQTALHPDQDEYNAYQPLTSRSLFGLEPVNTDDLFPLYYHAQHQNYLEDLPFWLGLAAAQGSPVLELGCGSGRVLLPLARRVTVWLVLTMMLGCSL